MVLMSAAEMFVWFFFNEEPTSLAEDVGSSL